MSSIQIISLYGPSLTASTMKSTTISFMNYFSLTELFSTWNIFRMCSSAEDTEPWRIKKITTIKATHIIPGRWILCTTVERNFVARFVHVGADMQRVLVLSRELAVTDT